VPEAGLARLGETSRPGPLLKPETGRTSETKGIRSTNSISKVYRSMDQWRNVAQAQLCQRRIPYQLRDNLTKVSVTVAPAGSEFRCHRHHGKSKGGPGRTVFCSCLKCGSGSLGRLRMLAPVPTSQWLLSKPFLKRLATPSRAPAVPQMGSDLVPFKSCGHRAHHPDRC